MSEKLNLELVTPEALAYSKQVDMAVIPGKEGVFGVLEGHSPLISALKPGIVEICEGDKISDKYFISGGFAEVAGEICVILAEEALDLSKCKRSDVNDRLMAARDELKKAGNEFEKAKAEKAVEVAEALAEAL